MTDDEKRDFPIVPALEGEEELGQEGIELSEEELPEEEIEPEQAPVEEEAGPPRVDFTRFYMDLFVEVYDIEKGLDDAIDKYTKILLARGIEVNPQLLFQQVELINTRLVRFAMTKRMCIALGLVAEMDSIIQQEMELVYKNSKPKQQTKSVPVSGEAHE